MFGGKLTVIIGKNALLSPVYTKLLLIPQEFKVIVAHGLPWY